MAIAIFEVICDSFSLYRKLSHSCFLTMAQQPWWDKASSFSRIHDHTQVDTPQSVGLLWTSDQPDAET